MHDKQEPTMGEPADLEFRPREYRGPSVPPPAKKDDSSLAWKVGIGVFAGIMAATLLQQAVANYRERKAIEQFNTEMTRIAKDPDPLGWQAAAQEAQVSAWIRQQNQRQPAPREYAPLSPGERCINGQRFRKLENGWAQSSNKKC